MTTGTTIGNNGTTVSQTLLDTMNGTNSTSGSSSSTSSKSGTSGTSATDLQNTFLSLLVAQLKNQDPTNPMDSSQMTSQLAQINTVSGISQLNTTLSSLATQMSAGQQSQAALLIGSTVLAPGSSVSVASGKAGAFGVQLANSVSDLQVVVKNSAGQIVNTIDLGKQSAGTIPVGWTRPTRPATRCPTARTRSARSARSTASRPRPPRSQAQRCKASSCRTTARRVSCCRTARLSG